MKLIKTFLYTFFAAFVLQISIYAQENIQVGSTTRNMIVYAPSGIEQNRPLVINMHGLNQDAAYQQAQAKWGPIADAERFLVVYPNGVNNSWDLSGTSDIDFILAIIDNMHSRYGIDRNRVYLSGFSMGGMMTYYAATKIADKIAAFAPVSGYLMGGPNTNSSRPIPLIHVHGTTDDVVPFSGVQTCLDAWIARNNCPTTAQVTDPYPSSNSLSGAAKYYWGTGDAGSEVVLISQEGKGHWWSMDVTYGVSTSQEIWNFCKNHSLGGSTGGTTNVWLEAECGAVGSSWNTVSDGNASNDQYITVQSGTNSTGNEPGSSAGYITYSFNVGESGTYTLWGRIIAPTPNDDSFWIRMDNGSWYMWNGISSSSSWTWDDCQSYNLSSGSHTLTVAYREDGTYLDKLYITNTGSTPSGEGSTASNCSGTTPSELVNNGIYEIEFQTNSNKVLDLRWGQDVNGGVLQPWDKNGATAQQWIALDAGNGYWRFQSNASSNGRVIDLENGDATNGMSIRLWDNYSNTAQTWLVTSVGNGYYSIKSAVNTAKSWDIPNCVMDASESLQIWDYYGTSCQLFKFNYVGSKSAKEDRVDISIDPRFDIYPTPSSDGDFSLSVSGFEENIRMSIFTLDGKSVIEQADLNIGYNFIKTGLNNGIYLIQVSDNMYTSVKKLIVQ